MSTNKRAAMYDEEFKRTLVNLYQSGGKTQATLCKEYGVSQTALIHWIKQYSIIETDDGKVFTAFLLYYIFPIFQYCMTIITSYFR